MYLWATCEVYPNTSHLQVNPIVSNESDVNSVQFVLDVYQTTYTTYTKMHIFFNCSWNYRLFVCEWARDEWQFTDMNE